MVTQREGAGARRGRAACLASGPGLFKLLMNEWGSGRTHSKLPLGTSHLFRHLFESYTAVETCL